LSKIIKKGSDPILRNLCGEARIGYTHPLMKLIVTEKNQTANRIASILSDGKAKKEGGPRSTVYSFSDDGDTVTCLGLRGHILKVDFPEEYRQWQEVDPRDLINAELLKIPTEKQLATTLKRLAKQADSVVIATDYDREGELIGADVMDLIRQVNDHADITRAKFSALTKQEIKEAFAHPDKLDENLAKAGEARQDIDLMWGASLTRFISLATSRLGQRFLSVGRVQSPTLALVVDREKEVQAFIPEDYWQVRATVACDAGDFGVKHATDRFSSLDEAQAAFDHVGDTGKVTSLKTRDRTINQPAPFNTTSFLAAASAIKISPARAMDVAETLYSRGLISYPRVDNTVYPESLPLRQLLESISGADVIGPLAKELLKKDKLTPTRGKKFSTDHPPIHPTESASKDKLSSQEWRIYELVARRFMATLADPARARSVRADLDLGGEPFFARGDVIVDEGFLRYYTYMRKKDEELPPLSEGEAVRVIDKDLDAKQTQPPARYTEGKLLEKMEELGLGTKSTRHSIIQNLIERGYMLGSPLRPSETGTAVASSLESHASVVTSPDMTADLEREMDEIAEGKKSLDEVVQDSREALGKVLDIMESEKEAISTEIREGIKGDMVLGDCSCGGEIRIRRARKSGKRFAGCARWPECEVVFPLPQRGLIAATNEMCEACGTPKIRVINKGRRPWELCLDPNCPTKAKPEDKSEAGKESGTAPAGAEEGESDAS